MKKSYLMMAAAVVMLTACSQTDVLNEAQVKDEVEAIGFSTYSNKVTRAISNTTLNDYHTTFGVWADKTYDGTTMTPVMENYQVAFADYKWGYAGIGSQVLKYWDKRASYNFYAYAPYSANVTMDANKVITIPEGQYAANENLQDWATEQNSNDFTGVGNSRLTESTDWMVADVISRGVKENSLVVENFRHTMSKLVVCLKSANISDNVEINSVSVNNVYGQGSYTTAAGWSKKGSAVSVAGSVGTIEPNNTYYSMEYLLIPSDEAPTFSVNYTINGDTYVVENAAIDGINKFESNTVYTLTVTISADPIVFDANVVNWQYAASGTTSID